MSESSAQSRFRQFVAVFLVYTVAVILWGAYVRVSFSGDGCGDHWPTCGGELIPVDPALETMVEYAHRLTSGFDGILAVVLLLWALRVFPRGHRARRGAGLTLLFMTLEAALGAGLVLFEYVASNTDIARGYWMAAHLMNTLALLWSITMTLWWAWGGGAIRVRGRAPLAAALFGTMAAMLLLGISGAITALGDTLFPAATFAEGLAQDLDPSSHPFVRLRAFHPLIALGSGALILFTVGYARSHTSSPMVRRIALACGVVYIGQVGLGFLNLALGAPGWMQIVHLFFADLFWVLLTLLVAAALSISGDDVDLGSIDPASA